MDRKLELCLVVILLLTISSISAQSNINFYIYDKETKSPITAVHAFIVNSSFGAYSEDNGQVTLETNSEVQEDLLLSHISFEPLLIPFDTYSNYTTSDTIWLEPNQIVIESMVVKAKRSSKWKRRYRKFKLAFLGEDHVARKCKILNPEVLRFEETEKALNVTAVAALKIDNAYLGYNIDYYLNYFSLQKDGSMAYLGKSYFTPYADGHFTDQRDEVYRSSPKHFFKNLVNNKLDEAGYTYSLSQKLGDDYVDLEAPPIDRLIKEQPAAIYKFFFPGVLKVSNNKLKVAPSNAQSVQSGVDEVARYTGGQAQKSFKKGPAISYISLTAPYVLLNKFGNVLNTKKLKEYGYWAKRRVAYQLPFEYGNDYELNSDEENSKLSINPLELLKTLLLDRDPIVKQKTLLAISEHWSPVFIAPLIEFIRLSNDPALVKQIQELLQEQTHEDHTDYFDWLQWLWQQEPKYDSTYAEFKALIYSYIDDRFESYFKGRHKATKIRMDEIVWGGVIQDGIPPLRFPSMLSTSESNYLDDNDIVFGLQLNGVAKAYPKRILAWHEFFVDSLGPDTIAGVYCTLCGTVIAYETDGHNLGTSGFLYRSNKLMYDKATQSLWNTIEGQPVVGPLADQNIKLKSRAIVTTTWKEWKDLHPDTKVLSIITGHNRDYDEGAAYREYYASDQLMFPVPLSDKRLNNKDEVFIVKVEGYDQDPLAISVNKLKRQRLLKEKIASTSFVILADKNGASRAYLQEGNEFKSYKDGILKDKKNRIWKVTESQLIGPENQNLLRLPAHNIFWFAWVNSYPETRLIK